MSGDLQIYSWDEIAKHSTEDDCWVVMYDKVLDVTKFLNEHPGGLDPLKDMAAQDITSSFESIGHTSTALVKSKTFIIGRTDPEDTKRRKAAAAQRASAPAPRWSDTKPEDLRKYADGGGIIPLWVLVAVAAIILAIIVYLLM
ncbi:putative mitochondrial cytochrome b5 [Leptomonas pyrrhocoris]|uniref:Putative mitochondrial cytochrome b5 n=1 Tax=Leptomonas pyrrhocoris TaxID=157538 RepID=A0A0M9FVX7_LEPPY|nr:putative mitochondrial cytochrome b5 [Leptomonas pyrrhocoris]XP_015655426.1 putative mitochondrial cytochrome b5 [Leptomonas pyrrhocoris]KPA76986.1 putative mitochondrial cytochrome b5 [Leptomonas pyrrhocoris]KPA76987.1 putative mitochondrial cytochrome b5 [Leptomonas pyrrhocoris]|eukprot:XP_015655425.1 putative mitochondrial cytochrome b5 [Leptomonas pyrrhocoris]